MAEHREKLPLVSQRVTKNNPEKFILGERPRGRHTKKKQIELAAANAREKSR